MQLPASMTFAAVEDFRDMITKGAENFCCGAGGGLVAIEEWRDTRLEAGRPKAEQIRLDGQWFASGKTVIVQGRKHVITARLERVVIVATGFDGVQDAAAARNLARKAFGSMPIMPGSGWPCVIFRYFSVGPSRYRHSSRLFSRIAAGA